MGEFVKVMREIIHPVYYCYPIESVKDEIDECFINNLNEAIVRFGEEPFKSYYTVETHYYGYSAIDPTRSFVNAVVKVMDEYAGEGNNTQEKVIIGQRMMRFITCLGTWGLMNGT